jgi:branched-subunit amino acid ABC-type transport system permease component
MDGDSIGSDIGGFINPDTFVVVVAGGVTSVATPS